MKIIDESQISTPLGLVLNDIVPTSATSRSSNSNPQTLKKSLDDLFPEQQYEKSVQKAKEILGSLANNLSAAELRDVIAETEYLVGSWLDDFEKEIFAGKTLNELLHEKGGL